MRTRPVATGAAIAALLFTLVGSASAQDAPPPSAADFRDKARAALTSGDVAGACLLFEQSFQAATKAAPGGAASLPADEVLFDLADCHEKLGKQSAAAAEFDQVASANVAKAG